MTYGVLADGVVLFHFLWILFLIFGGVWGRRCRTVRVLHIPAVAFAFIVEVCDWYCPLTHLEVWLRERQSPAGGYAGSFIAHYLEKVIYIQLPRWVIVLLAVLLVAGNLLLYRRRDRHPPMP
ncbi:MAG TPA: DUF2784 domain-containing protein [Geobacteraceae bacterium]